MPAQQPSLLDLMAPPRSRTGFPHHPGSKRDGTSAEAADAIAPRVGPLQDRVLSALRQGGPGTADQVAKRLHVDRLSIRPRMTELSLLGKIEETGERRRNASGKSATVWRIA